MVVFFLGMRREDAAGRTVARRTQNTPPRQHLVDGAAVDAARRLLPIFARTQMHYWGRTEQLLRPRIIQRPDLGIPASPFQEQAANVDAVLRLTRNRVGRKRI